MTETARDPFRQGVVEQPQGGIDFTSGPWEGPAPPAMGSRRRSLLSPGAIDPPVVRTDCCPA
jgi:hypothetical protein